MKTKREIEKVINWLDVFRGDVPEPCEDLPYIEDARSVQEILKWVLK